MSVKTSPTPWPSSSRTSKSASSVWNAKPNGSRGGGAPPPPFSTTPPRERYSSTRPASPSATSGRLDKSRDERARDRSRGAKNKKTVVGGGSRRRNLGQFYRDPILSAHLHGRGGGKIISRLETVRECLKSDCGVVMGDWVLAKIVQMGKQGVKFPEVRRCPHSTTSCMMTLYASVKMCGGGKMGIKFSSL